jgi:prepilin-type N-terminal cleavage/methylation domain-containing protein
MTEDRTSTGRRAGFTLIELMISVTILGGIFLAIASASSSAADAYDQSRVRGRVVAKANQVLDRIANEFVEADGANISPALPGIGATAITYQVSDGAGGFGPDRTIRFQMDVGELDDGIDNNADGRIDEAVILWIEDEGGANERSAVWCHNVRSLMANETANFIDDNGNLLTDERGLIFQRTGDVISIQLTLEEIDEDGRPITKTVQTSVRVRT